MMSREVIEEVVAFLPQVETLDITGGAPELHPQSRSLVPRARRLGKHVVDRCNLTILQEPGQGDLARFLAAERVEIIASLPCYTLELVDRQRGSGVYERSIAALRELNALGYGADLPLNLVYNPQGPVLPPAQDQLEADYKRELAERHGVVFNRLFTLANMPIQRFGSALVSQGHFAQYMTLLRSAHREENLEAVMCRSLVSVDWQGYLYHCAFNHMLGVPLPAPQSTPPAALVAFFASGAQRYFSFESIKAQQASLEASYRAHPVKVAAVFFLLYVTVTSLSVPGAALLTLVAGALFGLLVGAVLVSFASALGATLAFLASRFVLRDWVRARYATQLQRIDRGVAKEGALYLFTLRLIPAVPYFLINLAMGLTAMRPWTFYWVSQLAILPPTLVYPNPATHLPPIDSPSRILSPGVIGALVLLGLFPLVPNELLDAVKARPVYARWPRPRRFERNLIVIGGGSAGLVSAYIAAAGRAQGTLVRKSPLGGGRLDTGF